MGSSRLSARQKRKMFQEVFEELLIAEGFVFTEQIFLRIHPGQCFLSVGMDLAPSNAYVTFKARPFCLAGVDISEFGGIRVDAFHGDDAKWAECFRLPFEQGRLSSQFSLFERRVAPGFCRIHTIEEILRFEQNEMSAFTLNGFLRDQMLWEYLYTGQTENAEALLDQMEKRNQQHARDLQETTSTMLQLRKPAILTAILTREMKRLTAKNLQNIEESNQKIEQLRAMIQQPEELERVIRERISKNDEYCRSRWPSFYR